MLPIWAASPIPFVQDIGEWLHRPRPGSGKSVRAFQTLAGIGHSTLTSLGKLPATPVEFETRFVGVVARAGQ